MRGALLGGLFLTILYALLTSESGKTDVVGEAEKPVLTFIKKMSDPTEALIPAKKPDPAAKTGTSTAPAPAPGPINSAPVATAPTLPIGVTNPTVMV